ncbi:MAG: glycosyltransferase [Bacteroidales bacterium]|nr:glycosyltransferase [Bacteroidales bacterium]
MVKYNLNIVSFNVPYPADYGGVMDVFYKIKALHELGVSITLHCFQYGRSEQKELEKYCKQVFYYPRKTGLSSHLSLWPYIVYSRRSKALLHNLSSNDYPILLEGMHSAYGLISKQLNHRKVLLRSHNIEHEYYRYLANRERNVIRRIYYYKEAFLLKRLLYKLPQTTGVAAISLSDTEELNKIFANTFRLPPFHSGKLVESVLGKGDYALYHGNLSISENVEAAQYLIQQFANKEVSLVVAGKNPDQRLIRLTQGVSNISIVGNPDDSTMHNLIRNAHVILLPTFQTTGIKLKLLESLYRGRFCVANVSMTKGTELEALVEIAEPDFYETSVRLMKENFTEEKKKERAELLGKQYNNEENARLLISKIY